MKNQILFFLFTVFFCRNTYSQSYNTPTPKYDQLFKTVPLIDSNEPKWVKLLYSADPNYYEIKEAFQNYYKDHLFEKNTHTQNFKYFSKIIHHQNYILDDGRVYIPTTKELKTANRRVKKSRKNIYKSKKSANWSALGPFETYDNGGIKKKSSQANVFTFEQSMTNPKILYAGTESGGVFKSTDKGLNWKSVGDFDFNDGAVESLAIDPKNSDIVYVGTSESLYKTTDGGTNWKVILTKVKIYAFTINTKDPKIILAAGNHGLKKSTDGGKTWKTIFTDICWDIKLKTDNPNTVFLAKKNPTKNITEIVKSTDNGETFELKNTGWFSPIGGKAARDSGAKIGVTNADANRLYVVLIGEEDDDVHDGNYIGIYRSDNAGESWSTPYDGNNDGSPDNEPGGPYSNEHWCFTSTSPNRAGYDQGIYNLDIEVSDKNPDHLMVGSFNLFKSENGGVSYTQWGGFGCEGCGNEYRHPDIQEIEMNGDDVWVCNDGGIDYYDAKMNFIESRKNGINGSDYWGFDQGWNDDVLVGGRYHNGNAVYYENYPSGKFLSLGGGEASTGYVNKGDNKKVFHSDISGYEIPEKISGSLRNIDRYSMFPNENCHPLERSEIVNDPRYWNTLYLGKENKLWKSSNGGYSFTVLKKFGEESNDFVMDIEVSRNDPNTILVIQRNNSSGKLWKTTDAGKTWSEVTLPTSHRNMKLSLNTENEIFLSLGNGGNDSNKIFKSDNWGKSWTNLTSSTLNGELILNIQVQDGTDGGIYIASNKMIWYRNNSHSDWQSFSNNLPSHLRINKLLLFYKKEKIRISSNRGIWESDFYESSLPKAQPMVVSQTVNCMRASVQFEDYSILNHNGASWEWEFPGAKTINSSKIRNPKVTYSSSGTYKVKLKIKDGKGNVSEKTVSQMITVGDDYCTPDPEPKKALKCSENNHYASNKTINVKGISNFSFTAWIKPSGIQREYAGIFSLSGGCVLNFRESNNTLGIHWNQGKYWGWDSNLEVPAEKWSYVAITVSPTKITLYVNEKLHSWKVKTTPFDLTEINIGTFYGWDSRNYKGLIEEATFWKKTLTKKEIMMNRHLTKSNVSHSKILAYYQFNNQYSNVIYDKKGTNNLKILNNAELVNSDAPIGPGKSSRLKIDSHGIAEFAGTDCKMTFSTNKSYPDGMVVVTKINLPPSKLPENINCSKYFWIINNYGKNKTFTGLKDITFSGINKEMVSNPNDNVLFKRISNAGSSNDWNKTIEKVIDTDSSNKSISFSNDGHTNFSEQFCIGSKKLASSENETLKVNKVSKEQLSIYPNPLKKGQNLFIYNLKEGGRFTLYDMNGKQVLKKIIRAGNEIKISNVSSGIYFYNIETESKIQNGKLIIKSGLQ